MKHSHPLFDEVLDDPQPQSQARRGIRFGLQQRLEDVRQKVRMDADSVIAHDQGRGRGMARGGEADRIADLFNDNSRSVQSWLPLRVRNSLSLLT